MSGVPAKLIMAGVLLVGIFLFNFAAAPPVTVAFATDTSSGSEAQQAVRLEVRLNRPSEQPVLVAYAAEGGTASALEQGSGRDFTLEPGVLRIPPGAVAASIPLSVVDDNINEVDETLRVRLKRPVGATLGSRSTHTYTLRDNDRAVLLDVRRDAGARGDGVADDTAAIQKAIDAVRRKGGGVLHFPSGTYRVTSVTLRDNITYHGPGATILRPARQGKWMRTFTTAYSGDKDSGPLIVQGLTFDGNSREQGAYQNWELEQAHLIFLTADPARPGRLRAVVEDCTFQNGVADGVSIYTNVVASVARCRATDVFRGGFVLTGGNSSVSVYDLTTSGKTDPTGIDIEVDGQGFGKTLKVDVRLERLRLRDGDFDILVSDGSRITGVDLVSEKGPFYLYALRSHADFLDCRFAVGVPDGYLNRIVFPHDVRFRNCEFRLTRHETGKPFTYLSAADIWWQHPIAPRQRNQRLVFDNCRFRVDPSVRKTDTTYAIHTLSDAPKTNNRLVIKGGSIARDFDIPVHREPLSN